MAITRVKEIPVTKQSYPFSSAARYGVLEGTDYEEKEYFFEGTANVYRTEADRNIGIRFANAPYVNRMIVRAPREPERFSGNVVVEIINPTAFFEIERMWIFSHKRLLGSGDIYVGITSKPNTIAKLIEFDSERYRPLSWANPVPDEAFPYTAQEVEACANLLMDQDIRYETGLVWDMLREMPQLLKSRREDNPLKNYAVGRVVLTGWSQSACYLIRYLNDFMEMRKEELPGYDGYLAAGPPRHYPIPVNQYEAYSCAREGEVRIKKCPKPCIVLQTESENARMGAWRIPRPDRLEEGFFCRHYDIAGASHDTKYTLVDYYCDDPDMKRIHIFPAYTGKHEIPNNYPLEMFVAAAFRNLFYWIQTGVAPAEASRIAVDAWGNNVKDALGNSIGGIRSCLLDYPTGSYYACSMAGESGSREVHDLFGYEEPFPAVMLKQMYGSLKHYRELVQKHTVTMVAMGFVLKEDAPKLVEQAVQRARERGLD